MFELLLSTTMSCADADLIMLRIEKDEASKRRVEGRTGRDHQGLCTRM